MHTETKTGYFPPAILDEKGNVLLRMYFPYSIMRDSKGRVEEIQLEPMAYAVRSDGLTIGIELLDDEMTWDSVTTVLNRVVNDAMLMDIIEKAGPVKRSRKARS